MADETAPVDLPLDLTQLVVETDVQVRDATAREIDMRIVPWGVAIESVGGTEEFARGAFEGIDPKKVLLIGPEHERRLGIGHDGTPKLTRHPVGRGISLEDREDGAYMSFKVARTQGGDEVLALLDDGVSRGVSVEFSPGGGQVEVQRRGGRRHVIHRRAALDAVSVPVFRPAYGEHAAVLAVRSQVEGDGHMAETSEATVVVAEPQPALDDRIAAVFERFLPQMQARAAAGDPSEALEQILGRLERIEESARTQFTLPTATVSPPEDFRTGDWMKLVLGAMSGDRINNREIEARVAADLVTADNLGVVPPMFVDTGLRDTIDTSRPFLESTRQLNIPRSGMQLTVPVITTRPQTGVQAAEKDELTSTATSIDPANFNPTSIGGYGDISLQLLKRSDPSYLELYLDLLAEAYGIDADDKAVDALLAADINDDGGALDPESTAFGTAWANAAAVSRRLLPDRIWMSTAAVAAFIDAKANGTNQPLYSNLQANFTAGGGPGGTISGLRPVHVPALDDEDFDIIVGPSRGFGWAEDGTYTLQVDVPARAGRDVGLIGMLWFAPLYPAAFTAYTLASA